jgi:hypothetical protein
MTKARLNGLFLLLMGSVVFLLFALILERTSSDAMIDFKLSYYSARCLIQHCDPYNASEVVRIYQAAPQATQLARVLVYPPTTFSITVPFAMLPWESAHILWLMFTISGFIVASFLTWNFGANYAPILSGILGGYLLANIQILLILGNPSAIAISLCVIAVWCFLREQMVLVGVLCLAVSLAIKPQEAGLVWLYFLLAGGVHRKRALQTLLATVALTLPAVLWVWHVAPHWMQELHSNMSMLFIPGSFDYPGFTASGLRGIVNMQEVFGFFWNDPRVFNSVSYLVCAPLLLVWVFVTLRSCPSPKRSLLAIAAIAVLSLLPVYHHFYDTKLLLLTVPACAMLWAEDGLIGWLALLVTSAGLVLTGDISGMILFAHMSGLHIPVTGLIGQILMVVQLCSVSLILLLMGVFYLWVYVRSCSADAVPSPCPAPRGA